MQHARLGVTVQEVNQDLANSFRLDTPSGALVSSVEKGSAAEKAGLQPGDVVRRIDGKTIVFDRPLYIRRNEVVLPPGYEVVGLTVPSQILTESDGRIAISFVNGTEGPAPVVLRAAKGAQVGAPKAATKNRS